MSLKAQTLVWFILGNAIGLSGLVLVILLVKPAGYNQMGSDMSAMRVTADQTAAQSQSPLGANMVSVVVVSRNLDSGAVLTKSDLKLELMPKGFTSEKIFVNPAELVGRKITVQVKAGDVLLPKILN
jgi:Flp pilus assembly protein CpaB